MAPTYLQGHSPHEVANASLAETAGLPLPLGAFQTASGLKSPLFLPARDHLDVSF